MSPQPGKQMAAHSRDRHAMSIRISQDTWRRLQDLSLVQDVSYNIAIEQAIEVAWSNIWDS